MISLLFLFGIFFTLAYFVYLYVYWKILYYQFKNDKEIPLAFGYFYHHLAPFPQFFGVPTSNEKQRLILETAKENKCKIVRVLAGFSIIYLVSDFDLIHEICIKKSKNFIKPLENYKVVDIFGPNVLLSTGDQWKHQRVLFNPVFTQDNYLKTVCDTTVRYTKELMELYLKNDVNEIKLKKPFTYLTLDIISSTVFGFETKGLNPISFEKYQKEDIPEKVSMTLVDSLMYSIQGMALKFFLPKFIFKLPFFKKQTNSINDFREYAKFILEKSRKNETDTNTDDSLVRIMVKSKDGEEKIELSDEELISNMFIFFFAGHETTAGTMHWMMLLLAKNPKKQELLFQEVNEILQGRNASYDDIPKLKYANGCLKETLRIHSPIKGVVKKNLEKCTLDGKKFPKDTQFKIDFQSVHLDEKLWKNANEFQPERFMENYNSAHFMPFSYGKRNCIGYKFAEVEGIIILTTLIQQYSIHLKEGVDISKYEDEVTFATTTPKFDSPFVFKKR